MKRPINTNEAEGDNLSVDDLSRIIAFPFYCINISESVVGEHEALVSEETWIKAAKRSIEENGAEDFLKHLLENLKGNYV